MYRNILKKNSLQSIGIINKNLDIFYNLSHENIKIHEIQQKYGEFTKNTDTLNVKTGVFTGRSPKDKYIVKQEPSQNFVHWGSINKSISPQIFKKLHNTVVNYLDGKNSLYVFDGIVGRDTKMKKIRFITEFAWQHHFVSNMFQKCQKNCSRPIDFTILNACKVKNLEWKEQGLHSENFVTMNIEEKLGLIGGTFYAGEMKKSIFSLMNYWLPLNGVMSMHCSANIHKKTGKTSLFFGLSGTGKTTLSIDENVNLIGDDEHGWDEKGIFNIEGGCYAKTIHLSKEKEPFIYNAINSKALLENVCLKDGIPDYDDNSITENGRVSYPLENVENLQSPPEGGHPSFIFFLCCDAFGVLPPIVKLSPEQAMYYFLSGYTAKVAGTERGVNEPQATFSACFGEAFLPLHPTKYADFLQEKITKHNVPMCMINTGWSGGSYGVGKRMDIDVTRSCIDSVVNMTPDEMEETFTVKDEHFNFFLPSKLPKLKGSSTILNPINTWDDSSQFEKTKKMLITKFQENYQKYQKEGMTDFSVYGPKTKLYNK